MVAEIKGDIWIKKIYQPSPERLRIQLRFQGGSTKNLVVEPGKKIYLSKYQVQTPKKPSNFAMVLRKYLSNTRVKEIKQVGFDRIVEVTAEGRAGVYRLILELFGEGNVILVDEENRIKSVMKSRRFKHRELVGKEAYEYPPQRLNPFEITPAQVQKAVAEFKSLVRALAVPLGLGGLYSEEACLRAGLDKDAPVISEEQADAVVDVLKELRSRALDPRAFLVHDESGAPIDVVPVELRTYEKNRSIQYPTFNEALDEFFTEKYEEKVEETTKDAYLDGLKTINIRLLEQAKAIKRFVKEGKSAKQKGDIIYSDFGRVQQILDSMTQARKTSSKSDIDAMVDGADNLKRYLPKENAADVLIGGREIRLDLSMPAQKNAEHYYNRSKKAREKLKGARIAAKNTKAHIKEYILKGRKGVTEGRQTVKTREPKKRRWFETFRWFTTSDGHLVIGGRDATTNERIVKKHMEMGDVFVHADIHGAPAVVIKGEGKKISEAAIEEACQFAASNSVAWKSGAAYLDVYWVNPEQVSKTPRAGEYVGKGAFIISGKRNYARSKLALSVGVKIEDDTAQVICGPPSAIEHTCRYMIGIVPGRLKNKEAAGNIKEALLKDALEEHRAMIKRLNIDEIQKVLPTGGHTIAGADKI